MKSILMVCLGNICRSPLAEGLMKSKVDTSKVFVDSAGTGGWHEGEAPDQRSIAIAKQHGLDISKQKARKFRKEDFQKFDYIFAMDRSNYQDICSLASNDKEREKVHLLLDETHTKPTDVPDPYYGGADGFAKVYDLIDCACESIKDKLESGIY